MELDSSGGIVIAGWLNGDTPGADTDIGIVKYDSAGNLLWEYAFRGDDNSIDRPHDLALTADGMVYLTGTTTASFRTEFLTIALNPIGKMSWTRTHPGESGYSAMGRRILVSNDGVYVVGSAGDNALALKYDIEGTLLWVQEFNLGQDSEQYFTTALFDEQGNLVAGGDVIIGPGVLPHPGDVFVASYSPSGNLRWGGILDSTPARDDHMRTMIPLEEGSVGVLIIESGWPNLASNQGSKILKLTESAEITWTLSVPGRATYDLAADNEGRLYLPHNSFGSYYENNCNGIGLLCISASGSPEWNYCIPDPLSGGGLSSGFGISVDPDGVVYVSGEMTDRVTTAKVVPEDVPRDLDLIPGSCPNIINTGVAELDYRGNRPGAAAANKPTVSVAILGTNAFDVSRVDPSTIEIVGLSPLSHRLLDVSRPVEPRESDCECTTACADGYTDLVLYFDQEQFVAALGPVNDGEVRTLALTGKTKTGVPLSGSDCVTIKEGPIRISPLASAGEKFETGFAAYPNPFNAATVVSIALATESEVRLDVYDVLGRRVATLVNDVMPAGEHQVSWDAAGWASGVYFARLSSAAGMMTRKLVLVR